VNTRFMGKLGGSAAAEPTSAEALRRRVEELEQRLLEAREVIEAIRCGEVDAVVVGGPEGESQVYTLKDADRPYRLLIEQMREGAVTLSRDGMILYCNRAAAELLGLPPERVIGEELGRFVVSADGLQRAAFDRLLSEGGRREIALATRDGATVPVQISLSELPPTDDQERVRCAVLTDLTDERRQAAELAQAQARIAADLARREGEGFARLILESATDYAILACDLEGRVTTWNIGAFNIFGWTEAEMVGQPADRIWTEEDRAAGVPEAEMAAASSEGRAENERWHVRKDGSLFWAAGLMMPLRGGDGRHVGYIKILRDRTEQRNAEAALRLRGEEFFALADNIPSLCWIAYPDGHIFWYNRRWYEYTGTDYESQQGWGWQSVHDPQVLPEVAKRWRHSVATGEPFEMVFPLRAADGTFRPFLTRIVPIRDTAGEIVRWFGTNVDITQQRETEAELERRVAERSAELREAEEKLRQAQKMEAVGQLTGGIAHDFNNLLTGIVGSLELIQKRVGEGRFNDLQRYAAVAMSSANRASALTHRLLAFARRQPLAPKPVDVNKLVASMEDLVRRTVGEAIVLETVLAGGLWPAHCDANQLESALLNLCINARDAMPDGGRLTIETGNAHLDHAYAARERDVAPGQYVALSVTDTGTGMTPEVSERAFDPFFTTKPIGQGTGLGLSMLYGFVKQSGGHVRIYSEVGQGTTIKIYLPRDRSGPVEDVAAPRQPARAEAGETVLVVEDESPVRMLVVETLEELGYGALEAFDANSAVRILTDPEARIDLLVTDVGLPGGVNGRQLADRARELRPGLKVLFITGYAGNAAVGNGFLEPGMELVSKPFALDALAQKIRSMIGRRD